MACVDLEEGWPEDAVITRHPDFVQDHISFVRYTTNILLFIANNYFYIFSFCSGCVGEGGDHVNITLRNTGEITAREWNIVRFRLSTNCP